MDVPRIHFAGQFRADVNTRNNERCNFDLDNPLTEYDEWNYRGTNEWEFVDTVVTAEINKIGEEIPDSPLLGAKIFSNENRPFAKIVDIDTDFQVSSLYGLEFGLKYNNENLFKGKWSTSVIVHDMWVKMKCTDDKDLAGSSLFGAQSTTRITNLAWSQSELIGGLKAATNRPGATGDLSVSITYDVYKVDVFLVGRVFGTIGAAMANEPLNVGGERRMYPDYNATVNFPSGHPCYDVNQSDLEPLTYGAPFKVDSTRNILIADLGNALPMQRNGNPLNLGTLYFGILVDDEVVKPFGESIPYTDPNGVMWRHSGIIEQSIGTDIANSLKSSKLVVFIEGHTGSNTYPVEEIFPSMQSNEEVSLLLLESDYFIRPMDYYMDRLEYSSGNDEKSTSDFTLLVTRFGQPVSDTKVTVVPSPNQFGYACPRGAVAPADSTKVTDNDGHVMFTFSVNQPIPEIRSYDISTCEPNEEMLKARRRLGKFTPLRRPIQFYSFSKANVECTNSSLPIDGNLYNFYYCVGEDCALPDDDGFFLYRAVISILAFSTVTYETPYTWVDHVEPIFKQFHHLHYIMRTILDMSNYTEVTLPHNIKLLKIVFQKPKSDPNYMPTTRDLSPTKERMILEWLKTPVYGKLTKTLDNSDAPVCDTSFLPPEMRTPDISHFQAPTRCLLKNIPFNPDPETQDPYYCDIIKDRDFSRLRQDARRPPRALFGLGFNEENDVFNVLQEEGYTPLCNIATLREQLQNAMLLEFFTIPLYLTSMYTIVENCNTDAYQAIRDVAMQEMLHFVQAGNILIAIGGEVIIDDPDHVPSYPSTGGLPGGVLPGLNVSLEKFNLRHVHDTMMAIETPTLTCVGRPDPEFTLYTIGQFYKEISNCTHLLGDSIFDPTTAERQVSWPWTEPNSVGKVYIITDEESAQDAINQIIEQGEGETPLNPNQIATGQYGHFYRFEEIVCQHRLIKTDKEGYAYDGAPIKYNPAGVYPMRENPDSDTIVSDTDCHTEARAFHRTYRSFLRVLQETFSGEPDKIYRSIELMEALQVHAKKCIWTPYGEGNTCGPVWDYEWKSGSED